MPDQPLTFSPMLPDFSSYLPWSAGTITLWVLYAVFAFWVVYTFVAIYHWLKYSNASLMMFPAVALHLAVSVALMSYALSGNALYLAPFLP